MKCLYCAATDHDTPEACPRVSAIEYHQAAGIRRIEFFPPATEVTGCASNVGYVVPPMKSDSDPSWTE